MKPLKQLSACLLSLAFATLAGCGPATPPQVPKEAHVSMQTVSHTILFNDGITYLTPSERNLLGQFTTGIHPAAVSSVLLAADDTNPSAVARARSVRDFLIRQGFSRKTVLLNPTSDLDPRTIVLTAQYAKAIPPQHCPDWSTGASGSFEERDSSNFGCAYNTDFLIQMANPADFNGGHSTPVFDAPRDGVVIQRYLADTPQPSSSGSSGTGSSAGASASSAATGAASSSGTTSP